MSWGQFSTDYNTLSLITQHLLSTKHCTSLWNLWIKRSGTVFILKEIGNPSLFKANGLYWPFLEMKRLSQSIWCGKYRGYQGESNGIGGGGMGREWEWRAERGPLVALISLKPARFGTSPGLNLLWLRNCKGVGSVISQAPIWISVLSLPLWWLIHLSGPQFPPMQWR